jgi:hypothetical protein
MTEAAPTTQAEQEDAVREEIARLIEPEAFAIVDTGRADPKGWAHPLVGGARSTADRILAGPIAKLKAQRDRELRWVEFYEKAQADANRLVTYMSRRLRAFEAAEADVATLLTERDQLAELVNQYAAADAPEGMETLAKDRDRWFDRATAAEAQRDQLAADLRKAREEADVLRTLLRDVADEAETAALRAPQGDGAEAMREAAKIACLDLADTYREAGEDHIRNREAVKARQALDWADGAMMCAHAVAKLPLAQPDRLPETATGGEAE